MVCCGKPSKGCGVCRQRKILCDQQPDGCGQCSMIQRQCPGYRKQLDLMFRDETKNVVRKANSKKLSRSRHEPALATPAEAQFQNLGVDTPQKQLSKYSPTSLTGTYTFSSPIHEQAIGLFLSNYVSVDKFGEPSEGFLEALATIQYEKDEHLLASMRAVGLAGCSAVFKFPELMTQAKQQYLAAITLTNLALCSSEKVMKDSTLITVLILAIFERLAGSNESSLPAWANHVNGSAAILKLRGFHLTSTGEGQRMFIHVVAHIMVSCLQQGLNLPTYILEARAEPWFQEAVSHVLSMQLLDLMITLTDFNADLKIGTITDPQKIVSRAMQLEEEAFRIFSNMPDSWHYDTVHTEVESEFIFGRIYHVNRDFGTARLWTVLRVARILINEIIHNVLRDDWLLKTPQDISCEYSTQLEKSMRVMGQMQADVIASAPQYIGHNALSLSPSSYPTGYGALGIYSCTETTSHPQDVTQTLKGPGMTSKAPGVHQILYALYVAGTVDTTPEASKWIIRTLQSIGRSMGIQQAISFAAILEKKQDLKVLFRTPGLDMQGGSASEEQVQLQNQPIN